MSEEKKDYGKTLNLPKTDFPMRANLPEREPEIQKKYFWKWTIWKDIEEKWGAW